MIPIPAPESAPAKAPTRKRRPFLKCLAAAAVLVALLQAAEWASMHYGHTSFSVVEMGLLPGLGVVAGYCLLTGTSFLRDNSWSIAIPAWCADVLFYATLFWIISRVLAWRRAR